MKLVILESPFAGDVEKNIEYARACVRDALLRGEAPIASHLLYTQPGVLDDSIPAERQHGIDAGLAWRAVADWSVVYTDLGISKGMEYGIAAARAAGMQIEYRTIADWGPAADESAKPVEICRHCDMPTDAPGFCVCNGAQYEREQRGAPVASKEAVTLDHEQILEIGRRYGLWTLLSEAEGRLKFMLAIHAILAQRDASKAEGQS